MFGRLRRSKLDANAVNANAQASAQPSTSQAQPAAYTSVAPDSSLEARFADFFSVAQRRYKVTQNEAGEIWRALAQPLDWTNSLHGSQNANTLGLDDNAFAKPAHAEFPTSAPQAPSAAQPEETRGTPWAK